MHPLQYINTCLNIKIENVPSKAKLMAISKSSWDIMQLHSNFIQKACTWVLQRLKQAYFLWNRFIISCHSETHHKHRWRRLQLDSMLRHLNLLTIAVRDRHEGLTALFSQKQLISKQETFPMAFLAFPPYYFITVHSEKSPLTLVSEEYAYCTYWIIYLFGFFPLSWQY